MSSLMQALLGTDQYDPAKPTIVVSKCPRGVSSQLHQMVTKDGKPCKERVYRAGEPRGTREEVMKALRKKMRSLDAAGDGAAATTAFDAPIVVPKCPRGSKTVSAAEYLRYNRAGQTPTVTARGEVCISMEQAIKDLMSGQLLATPRRLSKADSKIRRERDEIKAFAARLQKATATPEYEVESKQG